MAEMNKVKHIKNKARLALRVRSANRQGRVAQQHVESTARVSPLKISNKNKALFNVLSPGQYTSQGNAMHDSTMAEVIAKTNKHRNTRQQTPACPVSLSP